MIIRLKLEESDAMKTVLKRKKTVALPIGEVLRKHWVLVLLGAGALPLAQVTYFKNTFALSWATSELGYDRGAFLGAIAIALVVQFIVQPFGAVLVSRIDMRKAMCIMVIPEFVLMPAMFFAIRTEDFAIAVVAMCLATIPHSMFYGAIAGVLARAFPANIRYTGLSAAYQLCSLIVGGGTPVLAQWMLNTSGNIVGVAFVSAGYAAVSLVCTLLLLNRTGFDARRLSTAEQSDADELQLDLDIDEDDAVDTAPSAGQPVRQPATDRAGHSGVGNASSDSRRTSRNAALSSSARHAIRSCRVLGPPTSGRNTTSGLFTFSATEETVNAQPTSADTNAISAIESGALCTIRGVKPASWAALCRESRSADPGSAGSVTQARLPVPRCERRPCLRAGGRWAGPPRSPR